MPQADSEITLSENTVILGDCLQILRDVPEKRFDVTITDPPYEEDAANPRRLRSGRFKENREVEETPLNFEPLTQETRVLYALEIARVTKRWIIIFCQVEAVGDWKRALGYAGVFYKRTAIWLKPDAQPQVSGDRPGVGCENIVCAYGSPTRSEWNGGGRLGIYYAPIPRGDERVHPTQKPMKLMEQLVLDFSRAGELILDPFCGSGTTLAAARKWNRRFLGIERNETYVESALQRISSTPIEQWAMKQGALL